MRSLWCGIAALTTLSLAHAGEVDKVELGRRLFMDPTVSRGGRFSCASCHDPERGFSDARPFSEDENGLTRRHSQPILDLAGNEPLHWDGEFGSLKDLLTARLGTLPQALEVARTTRTAHFAAATAAGRGPDQEEFQRTISRLTPPYYGPVTDPNGSPAPVPLLFRLDEDDRYARGFRAAFGSSEINRERIIESLHAYVLSLRTGRSAFDRYQVGDPEALTASARRGLALFAGKADCASCHTMDRGAFTDGKMHNTGVTFRAATLQFTGLALDGGAGEIDFVANDLGKFKTPSLRDVARRAPYMHDGSFATLEDVVGYYRDGGTPNRNLDPHIKKLDLTAQESSDLVAFLRSLTSDVRPGVGPARKGAHSVRIKVEDLKGRPLAGLTVAISPAGDRLADGRREPPQIVVTDSKGFLAFDFPAWTHVHLASSGYEIHYDWLIPDTVTAMTVAAAPLDKVAVKVRMADGTPPAKIEATKPGGNEFVARFRRLRQLGENTALYVAERRVVPGPFTVVLGGVGGVRQMDLSGGWADPLDLRPEPPQ